MPEADFFAVFVFLRLIAYDRTPFTLQVSVQVISSVFVFIPRTLFTNVPSPVALLFDFDADLLSTDQLELYMVVDTEADVQVELTPDTTVNVPLVVSAKRASPSLFLCVHVLLPVLV